MPTAPLHRLRPRGAGSLLVLALSATLFLGLLTTVAGARTVERLEAEDNVAAAIEWSEFTFAEGTAPTALLSRDNIFADALASGMAQGELTAPLLLTPTDALDARTAAELERLGTQEVVILGGPPAVSDGVEQALQAAGYETTRLAGPTRIGTALAVTQAMAPETREVVVARAFAQGQDPTRAFADSLATAAYSASTDVPVVYTNINNIPDATREYLEQSVVENVTIAGDEAAVSAKVEAEITAIMEAKEGTVTRIGGDNRAATAVDMNAARGLPDAGSADRLVVMEGYTEDAWAAGFPAAAQVADGGVPVLLTNGDSVPDVTRDYLAPANGRLPLICAPFVPQSACDAAADAAGL